MKEMRERYERSRRQVDGIVTLIAEALSKIIPTKISQACRVEKANQCFRESKRLALVA
jgi:hypothetical protein